MNAERVKETIKTEFGSLSEFCRISGRDRYELQKFFANCSRAMNEEREQELYVLEDEALRLADRNYYVDQILTTKIKFALKRNGGLTEFSNKHPEFNYNFLWNVINRQKRRTEKIDHLIKILQIDE